MRTHSASSLFALGILLGGCGRAETRDGREAGPGTLPPTLEAADGLAEDVQADIDTLGWAAAGAKVAKLRQSEASVEQVVTADSAENAATGQQELATYRRAVDSLGARIERRDRLAALASANTLSRVLAAMSANYRSRVPAQVALLDVAGRDAIYAAEGARWNEAAAAVHELRSTYASVSDHVTRAQRPLNDRFQRTLEALAGAVSHQDIAQVRRQATSILDDVDLIEGTY
jgi:hypothetical protein